MKYLLMLGLIVGIAASAEAQIPALGGVGKLVNDLTSNGLSDDAFTSDFLGEKKGFLKKTKKLTTYAALGGHIKKLIGVIKPGMFKDGVDVKSLTDAAGALASMADATGLLGKLQGSLKPEAFKDGWDSEKFSSALDALS